MVLLASVAGGKIRQNAKSMESDEYKTDVVCLPSLIITIVNYYYH